MTAKPIALEQAIALHRAGDLTAAEAGYGALLREQPEEPNANHNLGVLQVQRGEPALALPWLRRALAADPGQPQYWTSLIEALARAGYSDMARLTLARAAGAGLAERLPAGLAARLATLPAATPHLPALLARERGAYAEAATWFDDWLATHPGDAAAWARRARLALLQEETEGARDALARAMELAPAAPLTLRNLARLRLRDRDAAGARACAEEALAAAPDEPENRLLLAAALAALGQPEAARPHLDDLLEQRPDWSEARAQRALARRLGGDLAPALADARVALGIKPYLLSIWRLRADLAAALALDAEADAALGQVLRWRPDDAAALLTLGERRRRAGDTATAMALFERAVAVEPANARAWFGLGIARAALGQRGAARLAYDVALRRDPDYAEVANNRAALAMEVGDWSLALADAERATRLQPDNLDFMLAEATVLGNLGRRDAAIARYRRILDPFPDHPEANQHLADFVGACPDDARFARLETALRAPGHSPPERRAWHFTLGKLYDDIGDAERAFAHLVAGHRERRACLGPASDPGADARRLKLYARFFSADWFAARRAWGSPSQRPVFVIGMPRSGTSLIEQILASHPAVFGAGELPDWRELAAEVTDFAYPEAALAALAALTPDTVGAIAARYLAALDARAPAGAARVVDKMPQNFEYLWLMMLAFPNATLIHCRRHPLATCWSIFSQDFAFGHAYADDLAALGAYYRHYRALMALWEPVLPVPIHAVDYERLVAAPEPQARALLAACALDFDPACLAFHRTERPVMTASVAQVRQPLYTSSVARWRRYAVHLQPLRAALGDVLDDDREECRDV